MSEFDLFHAVGVYAPADSRDCDKPQYAARVNACATCEHLRGNLCAIDAQLIAVKARRKTSVCQAGFYPDQAALDDVVLPERTPSLWNRAGGWLRSVGKALGLALGEIQETPALPLRPVRVVFITPGIECGGAERWILSLCRWLAAEVVGVVSTSDTIQPSMRQELQRVGVEVTAFQQTPDAARELLGRADVILAWGIGDLEPYLAGVQTPLVWVSHGACNWTTKLVYAARPRVTHWVGVSEMALRVLPRVLQTSATVIHNGVDVERTSPAHGRAVTRRRWGIREDQIVVGYMGRFSPEKRPAAVAEAVACLPANYVAVMVGNGWKDAETRVAAERAAPGRVIFTGYQTNIGDALAAFDVWVNASPSEGMCLSLIEAWLAGVPTVSTRTGAVNELEDKHGALVWSLPDLADGKAIAETVQACISGGVEAERLNRARKLAWDQLTSAAMAARWDMYLDQVTKERK